MTLFGSMPLQQISEEEKEVVEAVLSLCLATHQGGPLLLSLNLCRFHMVANRAQIVIVQLVMLNELLEAHRVGVVSVMKFKPRAPIHMVHNFQLSLSMPWWLTAVLTMPIRSGAQAMWVMRIVMDISFILMYFLPTIQN